MASRTQSTQAKETLSKEWKKQSQEKTRKGPLVQVLCHRQDRACTFEYGAASHRAQVGGLEDGGAACGRVDNPASSSLRR